MSTNPPIATTGIRPDPARELRNVALERFASAGYAGTSLQQIADAAGYSKSSVLYHFSSKEALLEAALAPALDRLEQILDEGVGKLASEQERLVFVEQFVDFLLQFRLEVHIFINQGQSLVDVPVIDRANATIMRLAGSLMSDLKRVEDRVRFSVALGGAAYTLVAGSNFGETELLSDGLRDALVNSVSGLLAESHVGN